MVTNVFVLLDILSKTKFLQKFLLINQKKKNAFILNTLDKSLNIEIFFHKLF